MATNEILQFAETDTGTNLLTQAEYAADSQRPIGNQPGVARSKLVNKALRQASLIAAGLAEYIADNQANNITDALTPQNIADYLQAALTDARGVTPPQFDNDTSLATTAFVQRALGNIAGVVAVNAATTLNASHAGAVINTYGAGGFVVTLPLGSSIPSGTVIEFFSTAANVTIQRQGSDVIYAKSSPSQNSVVIGNGDTVKLIWSATSGWLAVGGSGQIGSSNSFGSSLAANGYQKLPSGLIIQWFSFSPVNTSQATLNYPITFPNASVTWAAGCAGSVGATLVRTGSIDKSSIQVTSSNTGNSHFLIVLGY